MSREIKFRAWDEKNKRMIDLGRPFYHSGVGGMLMYAVEPMVKYDNWDKKNPNLMQYTGLKDKNGKEIYEGDVLKWEDTKCVVGWDESGACFGGMEANPPLDRIYYWKEANVIGNIYENPELIEKI